MPDHHHRAQPHPVIAIIGGGFSGAAVAWHLHRAAPHGQRVIIIEPHDEIGRGLAYSTTDPVHRINVPAMRMNIDAEDETHFTNWLATQNYAATDPATITVDERLYPTRHAFGSYVRDQIDSLGDEITHLRTRATALAQRDERWRVTCANGEVVEADIAVLAVCHTPPDTPSSLTPLQTHPLFYADPWRTNALDAIRRSDKVLIVGTGLTMADTIATLDRLGHTGKIVAISRRGLRSRPHAGDIVDVYGDFLQPPSHTALDLLRRVRKTIHAAARDGQPWQTVINQAFRQGQDIWRTLHHEQRKRLLQHLRPFWDTHRFRIAPQVHEVLERRIAQGTLEIRAASVRAASEKDANINVELRPRHSKTWEHHAFDALILATGPAHGTVFDHDPLLAQMKAEGLARPDPLGLGIAVDDDGRAVGNASSGQPLYVAGPLARGTFGELMGISDLARYAKAIAGHIVLQEKKISVLQS